MVGAGPSFDGLWGRGTFNRREKARDASVRCVVAFAERLALERIDGEVVQQSFVAAHEQLEPAVSGGRRGLGETRDAQLVEPPVVDDLSDARVVDRCQRV